MAASFGEMEAHVAAIQAKVAGPAARGRMKDVGGWGVRCIEKAVAATPAKDGDLGDRSMSGWHGKGQQPFKLTGHIEVKPDARVVEVAPAAEGSGWRKGAGPMRVLEAGRSAYTQGDRRKSGTYVSKKTGERRDKTRKVRQNMGATEGKGTWTNAAEAFRSEASARYVSAMNQDIARVLGG